MQIKCSSCNRAINIPDEKLPKNKAFSIACPGCKEKIKVDQHLRPAAPASAPAQQKQKKEALDIDSLVESHEFEGDDDDEQVFYEENAKIALILDDQNKETWTQKLNELDYKIQYAKSPEHAAHKMKFTQFHLIILNKNFGDVSLEKNVAYQMLLDMQMSTRRKIFLVLVGDNFKSMNNMQAFSTSANMVFNPKDMGKFAQILKQAISDNDLFYKNFRETLTTLGKV
ncbi:MAG: hypothetical protein ACE5G9_12385 [Nitrospinales bacterium]